MITEDDVNLKFVSSLSMSNQHHLGYRDSDLGITKEVVTNKYKSKGFGKSQVFYFLDNDPREFRDLAGVIEAYNEKYSIEEESKDIEVKYVMVLKKRKP